MTQSPEKAETIGKVSNEIVEMLDVASLSQREFDCIHALLISNTAKEAWRKGPYKSYAYFKQKEKQLRPLLNQIYSKLRAQAVGQLVLAAPKASDALVDMLDKLEGTTKTERRKTAETILDRSLGRPIAKVAVKSESNSRIEITFPEWLPTSSKNAVVEGKTIKAGKV